MKEIPLIDGQDLAFERKIFNVPAAYDHLESMAQQKWRERISGSEAIPGAWFQAVIEFLYMHGYRIAVEDESKILKFNGPQRKR